MVTLTAPDADLEFPGAALQQTVESLGVVPGIALARIWLVQSNYQCMHCRSANPTKTSELSLHLVASHGRSRNESSPEVWNRTSGGFHQLPLHSQKIGRIASTGEPLLVRKSVAQSSLLNPDWVEHEAIQSFFGYPLIHSGHIQGVLAVFSRRELDDRDVNYLSQIAASVTSSLAYASQIATYRRRLQQAEAQNLRLRADLQTHTLEGPLVAVGTASQKWDRQIRLAAHHLQPVLISGGCGAGKEFTARLIHERSSQNSAPFVKVDANTIDASVLESLFAAQKDAGTVFIDAIEHAPHELQELLATLINSISRSSELGATEAHVSGIRVLSSTTVDLHENVANGSFNKDLFSAITVTDIQVPALAERHEDLAKLASDLLRAICRREHRPEVTLVDSALQLLKSYSWPGNVRQLRTVLESCLWRSPFGLVELDSSTLSDLLPGVASPVTVLTADEIKRRERANIEACLRQCGWKVYGPGGAAELLGMKPTSLIYRMKALKIRKPAK